MRKRTLIIAEAGVNHNGDLDLAKLMVERAAGAGADFVKFQTFQATKLVSRDAVKAAYQEANASTKGESQFEMIRRLELDRSAHLELIRCCDAHGIQFLSTGFDHDSVDMLADLGIPLFKIPSGEITNLPYLRHVASKQRPVILSTGMATIGEIEDALDVLEKAGLAREDLTVLHCNTEYPTPMEDVNLLAMNSISCAFGVKTGYSDHTLGIEVPIAAVALGAVCIEKHFTLDRSLDGPDHRASLEPDELKDMVTAIRNVERALGSGRKVPSVSESKNIAVARRSLHLSRDVEYGEVLTTQDLEALRPGDGISPMELDKVVGRIATVKLSAGQKLEYGHFA